MKKTTISVLIIIIFISIIFLLVKNKKTDVGNNIDLTKQGLTSTSSIPGQELEGEDSKLGSATLLPEKNNFPPSQRSIDGFFIGQNINAVKNILGEPSHPELIVNQQEGEETYIYDLPGGSKEKPNFLAFGIYNPERGIIAAIQLTGDQSDKETFLGLKLGDSKDKVINTLGKPSKIIPGTRGSDLYLYDDRNYSVELDKDDKLISVRIDGSEGFVDNPEIGDFVKDFTKALNTNDISKISEFLMPDVEIITKNDVYQISKRFLDELFDLNSKMREQLLFAPDSVKNILNNYRGEINMELRITENGPSGYVYKFPGSEVLREIFVIEQAGKYRAYEIWYKDYPRVNLFEQ